MKTIGTFLKEKREAAGLTQKEVAKTIGYTSSQFCSNIERGVSFPTLKSLPTLARLYNVDESDLADKLKIELSKAHETRITNKFKEATTT